VQEVPGSIPGSTTDFFVCFYCFVVVVIFLFFPKNIIYITLCNSFRNVNLFHILNILQNLGIKRYKDIDLATIMKIVVKNSRNAKSLFNSSQICKICDILEINLLLFVQNLY